MAWANKMIHTPIIYLASPIDNGVLSGVDKVHELLVQDGFAVYWPQKAWSVRAGSVPNEKLQGANMGVLDFADGLLACLKADTLTVGTIIEIYEAQGRGIPTVEELVDVVEDLAVPGELFRLGGLGDDEDRAHTVGEAGA